MYSLILCLPNVYKWGDKYGSVFLKEEDCKINSTFFVQIEVLHICIYL